MQIRISRTSSLVLAAALSVMPCLSRPAHAIAVVDEYTAGCRSFSASGTTNQPFVTLFAHNNVTGGEVFEVFPVTGGSFSETIDLPPTSQGTLVNYEAWGSPTDYVNLGDPGYWDGEEYFNLDLQCFDTALDIPTMSLWGYGLLAALLAVAGFFTFRSQRRARA